MKVFKKKNSQIFVELDNFESIYDDIEVVDAQLLSLDSGATSIQKVSFNFRGKHFDAFAYALINQEGGSKTSTLVIPGSGLNQASMIFKKNPNNYHFSLFEILAELKNNDSYIFIHPNEGVLAFHNGSHKLNYNFITNYQINNGGSYSASYLIQTIAFEKYLKLKYSQTIIMGLSQGGLATMINALESEPDIAIVSSGYSVLNEKIEWSGHDQIIIPGISKRLRAENVKDELAQSKTSWLFTYGLKEKGIYKMEANQSLTASLIDDLPNVDVDIHQEGHQFPVKEINRFLQNKLK
ncbi:hypothetical protein [Algoriphagus boritolerans]|uniref:hypothetical protein n=1 Tax=Algoriphagus boritolerans TaxID=308111 RepID=UPI000A5E712C